MLETVAYDPRSYNALGNACYVNGDTSRAIDYLQRLPMPAMKPQPATLHLIKRRASAVDK